MNREDQVPCELVPAHEVSEFDPQEYFRDAKSTFPWLINLW